MDYSDDSKASDRSVVFRQAISNVSFASMRIPHALPSPVVKSERIMNRYPLKDRDVVLDLDSQTRYEELQEHIKDLGGRIVDTIDENKLPFLLISDHQSAIRLETMKGIYDKMSINNLPLLLKEAARRKVKVRSYSTFVRQFAKFKARIRSADLLANAPQKSALEVHEFQKPKILRLLRRPFIKWQDNGRHYAPIYQEFSTPRCTTFYFGADAGICVFRRVTAEQLERRKRKGRPILAEDSDPRGSPDREKSSKSLKPVKISRRVKTPENRFCDLCAKAFRDMEMHYKSREHLMTLTRPGVYDEVDMYTGTVVDYIMGSFLLPPRLHDIKPIEDEPCFPTDENWDFECSEGNYKCTLLNKMS